MTTRAACYHRISLDAEGNGLALDRQRAECQRIARERKWRIVTEFSDSISAYDKKKQRPGYDALVEAYRNGEFTALLVYDLDRLTRQPAQLEQWIDWTEDRGLIIVTANGEADLGTDGGRMYARIKAAVARAESERKGARQRSAARQRANQRRPHPGTRPLGYTVKGQLDPGEAEVVKGIFASFLRGDSLHGITKSLNDAGTPTRNGRAWNQSTVRFILRNPRYCGRSVYNRRRGGTDTTPGTWPTIITEAEFDQVQAKLSDPRRRTQTGTHRRYHGSALYRCDRCDRLMTSHSRRRYLCTGCGMTRNGQPIDDLIIKWIKFRLTFEDCTDLLTPPDNAKARQLDEKIKTLRARLIATESDYDASLIDGMRFRVKTEKLNVELHRAEAERLRIMPNPGVAAVLGAVNPVDAFARAPLMQQRAVIDFFVSVRLLPVPRGRRGFDESTVHWAWRAGPLSKCDLREILQGV
jgi:DNA invertase Pin-like site-specific DNA recombinase